MSPALIALLPFFGALLPGLLVRAGRDVAALACGLTSMLALIGLCLHIPGIMAGQVPESTVNWVPQLGLAASFRIDGLGLLFGILILGIGILIICFARYYLAKRDPAGQFFTYLMLFQGAMMGVALSDNLLLLLIFWELTSLSSFLLIGYWRDQSGARQGALMALTVTGLGGLAMIAGMLLLGQIAGSFQISEILDQRQAIQASPLYLPALVLILLGAFTKSAQFPFHFWLPRAMAAPTPVSAYLHSATMVKAGIFLMARLWPVLSGTPEWFWIVTLTGLTTMVLGAFIAIFRDDLKSLLAYSTVSHLGLITMLLGFGTAKAATAAVLHIIAHAIFKAALFMTAGIIDHETGRRDLSRLGGLARLMPLTFALALISALAMAGIAPMIGFISKEAMLDQVATNAPATWMVVAAALGSAFSVGYSLRILWQAFGGAERKDFPQKPHDPGIGLWLPPAILAVLALVTGLWAQPMLGWLVEIASGAVTATSINTDLALWHGVNTALKLSLLAIAGGVVLLAISPAMISLRDRLPRPDAGVMFAGVMNVARRFATALTDGITNGANARALAVFVMTVLACGVVAWTQGQAPALVRPMMPVTLVPALALVALVVASICVVLFHNHRLLALIVIAVVGLIVSAGFIYLSAPDLALTQISVEVVTVIIMLLALNYMPSFTPRESGGLKRGGDALIAGLLGLGIGALAYVIMRSDFAFPSMADYMVQNSYKLGGGTNVVNVILVDFRGYDTMGEITVLGIAALVIFALTETLLKGAAAHNLAVMPEAAQAGDRHPLMLIVITRILLPLTLVVALYIFLRGHNMPGGGFVAALVTSVAFAMQYMASGYAWTVQRQRLPYHTLIGLGVISAVLTGAGAWFAGRPFLTSNYGYFKLPMLEKIELATAMGFDLGVYLCVVGAVMLTLNSFGRFGRIRRHQPAPTREVGND